MDAEVAGRAAVAHWGMPRQDLRCAYTGPSLRRLTFKCASTANDSSEPGSVLGAFVIPNGKCFPRFCWFLINLAGFEAFWLDFSTAEHFVSPAARARKNPALTGFESAEAEQLRSAERAAVRLFKGSVPGYWKPACLSVLESPRTGLSGLP